MCICAMASFACAGTHATEPEPHEGWMGEDIFRVTAGGAPRAGLVHADRRKESARAAAILSAHRLILEKFVGMQFESTFSDLDFDKTRSAMRDRFTGTIHKGRVIRERYDAGDNCRITYQVEEKGLRKSVMGFGIRE
jgi:hypothetical protein